MQVKTVSQAAQSVERQVSDAENHSLLLLYIKNSEVSLSRYILIFKFSIFLHDGFKENNNNDILFILINQ